MKEDIHLSIFIPKDRSPNFKTLGATFSLAAIVIAIGAIINEGTAIKNNTNTLIVLSAHLPL